MGREEEEEEGESREEEKEGETREGRGEGSVEGGERREDSVSCVGRGASCVGRDTEEELEV